MGIVCNICGSTDFVSYGVKPRVNAQCVKCQSLERHRALHYFLREAGLLSERKGLDRCLQLAPERVTHDYLLSAYGAGLFAADLQPEQYAHAKCLQLELPDGFDIFPDQYFRLIVHNHVLEHIPGSFKLHIEQFWRILEKGGVMAFTIPETGIVRNIRYTVEGGELLPTDSDRILHHGQRDHYKTFGADLIDYLKSVFSEFTPFLLESGALSKKLQTEHNAHGVIFWCIK